MDGALVGSFSDTSEMIERLAETITPLNPEFVTVYYGEGVDEAGAQSFSDGLGANFSEAETALIRGGQPVYYYIISVE